MFRKIIFPSLLLSLAFSAVFLYLVARDAGDAQSFAIVKMAWGLIILWVGVCGSLMHFLRDRIRAVVLRIPLDWRVKFVLFATLLALIEEAITVSLTNLGPFLGSSTAAITASTNYLDVIFFHSVIVFIPLFIAWAFLLSRYDFKPFSVFLLFGIMGIIAEMSLVGPIVALLGFAQWIFVYGLMVYLPAYAIPKNRGARPVLLHHYVLAIPAVFLLALPLLLPIVYVISSVLDHPSIH